MILCSTLFISTNSLSWLALLTVAVKMGEKTSMVTNSNQPVFSAKFCRQRFLFSTGAGLPALAKLLASV